MRPLVQGDSEVPMRRRGREVAQAGEEEVVTSGLADLDGEKVKYLVAGSGPAVLLVPGWSLPPNIYAKSMELLARQGFRVAIPEIYGSRARIAEAKSIAGLAEFAARFAKSVFLGQPYSVIGHSLGGGIAICLAAAREVGHLALVNSIGDPSWSARGKASTLAARPLADWVGAFFADMRQTANKRKNVPRILYEATGEIVRNPARVVQCGLLARTADLRVEITKVAASSAKTLAIWTRQDPVVPYESFASLARGLGAQVWETNGAHGWIFTAPEEFSRVVGGFLQS